MLRSRASRSITMTEGSLWRNTLLFALPLMFSAVLQLMFNAADTIVVCEGKVLGKPKNAQQAEEMLTLLSGRDHQVMTGVTVLRGSMERVFTEVTDLHFRPLSRKEILGYIASGEPMDKAGAYGIQGGAALFCDRMTGDYYNVMGLPVCRLGQVLKELAPDLMGEEK